MEAAGRHGDDLDARRGRRPQRREGIRLQRDALAAVIFRADEQPAVVKVLADDVFGFVGHRLHDQPRVFALLKRQRGEQARNVMEQHRRVGDGNAAVAVDVRRTELRDGQPSGARHIIEKKLRVLVGHAAVAVDVAEQAGEGRKSEQRARQQRRQQQRGKNPSYPIQDGSPPPVDFLPSL